MESSPSSSPSSLTSLLDSLQEAIGRVVVGQQETVRMLLAGLLADGHILLEGVPGVAKTLTAKLLARLVGVDFSRIQFTPDLMPGDVIGTSVFHPQTARFEFKKGPVFSNIVLIDEINRAPAKTQAALFEVMEERQITVDGVTHQLQAPFLVVATQNPIEHEGTYRLPEAQLDRFLLKIVVGYPTLDEEVQVLERQNTGKGIAGLLEETKPIIDRTSLQAARDEVARIHAEPKLLQFIARLVHETRTDRALYIGASPRASLALLRISKALAVLAGRDFIIPDDVLQAAPPVLRHRVALTPEREMEGATADSVLRDLLSRIEIPR